MKDAAYSREYVLNSALTLWAALLDGVPLAQLPPETVDVVMSTVGGELVTGEGTLRRVGEIRSSLVSWLTPRPGTPRSASDAEDFDIFLVSWGLSVRAEAMGRWRGAGSPRRADPAQHLSRASGREVDQAAPTAHADYSYFTKPDLSPEPKSIVGRLVDDGVARLLNVGTRFGEPKPSRFDTRMRELLTPHVARQIGLFDSAIIGGAVTPTARISRLAFVLAVGVTLGAYAETAVDEADDAMRRACDDARARWNEPADLTVLRRLCIDYDILGGSDNESTLESLGVDYADFRAVFRTFAEEGADFGGEPVDPASAVDDATVRRVGALLELAITDVRDNSASLPTTVAEQVAIVIDEVADTLVQQRDTPRILRLQEALRTRTDKASRIRAGSRATFLEELLDRLARVDRIGTPIVSTSDVAATWDDVDRLVHSAHNFLDGGNNYGPEWLIQQFKDRLPSAVRALTPGRVAPGLDHVAVAEARWQLLEASGRALTQRPDVVGGLVVAGSFAELGWFVANEHDPERIRNVLEPLHTRLRKVASGQLAHDLVGPITRILRTRPLADNKHDNFDVAQRMAHDSVRYGSRALYQATHEQSVQTVSRIASALTGFQLSLLQAGGVFVRSAEAELVFEVTGRSPTQQLRHGAYIRDLTSASLTYTNIAVQRLKDIRELEASGLLSAEGLNYPVASSASTAAMGMRTLLLWATLHLAFPDAERHDIRAFIKATPGQFHDMLKLPHLTKLNFADMTRIAMHYTFLSGDLRHPATGARQCHPDTPAHLRPRASGNLDLDACGRYLIDSGYDTGILDVIRVERVIRALDETSGGRYSEWLAAYENRVRRKPEKFRRGAVSRIAFAPQARDATIGW